MNRHLRKAVVVSAALTAGLLMTACQNGTGVDSSGKRATGAAAVGEKTSGGAKTSGAENAADSKTSSGSEKSKGVSGSFKTGKVTYLAPYKYIVSAPGKGDQQFWVADDTEVYGTGTICGEAGAKVDAPCTIDQLEAALKKGAVNADVEMKNGVATLVTERRAPRKDTGSGSGSRDTVIEGINKGKGVSGTWFGNVSYLAPGKYTVSDIKGVEQQFLTAEDTKIVGYDDICGGPGGGQDGTPCTENQLEAAAKKGFSAEVVISNGIAVTVRDDH